MKIKQVQEQEQNYKIQNYKKEVLELKKLHVPKTDIDFNIPKILHLYWDRSPMSKLQTLTPVTFHKQNPDWRINLYIPKQKYIGNAKYVPIYTGKDYFNIVEKLSYINIIEFDLKDYFIREDLHNILRSDIFRYQILYEQGGVWSDFDVLWLKPISHIIDIDHVNNISKFGFSVCFFEDIISHHSIGILIAIKNHLFYKELMIQTSKKVPKLSHQIFGVDLWHNLYPTLSSLLKKYKDCLSIKYKTFYPYSIFEMNKLYEKNDTSVIEKNTICIHWFNGHSLTKEYINNNYKQECSMTLLIKSIDHNFFETK